MPRRNIYLPQPIDERFEQEPNKSGLVSELLAIHYGIASEKSAPTPEKSAPIVVVAEDGKPPLRLCPNGHLANLANGDGNNCQEDGCKYSLKGNGKETT